MIYEDIWSQTYNRYVSIGYSHEDAAGKADGAERHEAKQCEEPRPMSYAEEKKLRAENERLRDALGHAKRALDYLAEDDESCLGIAGDSNGCVWPIIRELLSKIDAALADTPTPQRTEEPDS